jgi:drug/metabolite transporter (DMT)-like permease
MDWLLGVLGVAIFYSLAQIHARKCLNSKIDYRVFLAYYLIICGILGIIMMTYLYVDDVKLEINGKLDTIVLTTMLFVVGTTSLLYSISRKIELGIMNTVRTALQIIITIILGNIYLKEEITKKQLMGTMIIIVGMIMVGVISG